MMTEQKQRNLLKTFAEYLLSERSNVQNLKKLLTESGVDIFEIVLNNTFSSDSTFKNLSLESTEQLKTLLGKQEIIKITLGTNDNSRNILKEMNASKLIIINEKVVKSRASLLLAFAENKPSPESDEEEMIHWLATSLYLVLQVKDTCTEESVFLQKQVQHAKEEKQQIEEEYIKVCKDKQRLKTLVNKYENSLKESQTELNELYNRIEQYNTTQLELEENKKTDTAKIQELEKENKAVKKYIENLSNNLRNPVNGIVSLSEKIYFDTAYYDNKERYSKMFEEMSDELLNITEKLSDLALIADENQQLNRQRIDLREFLKGIESDLEKAANNNGIRLSVKRMPENSSHTIICDKDKLEKVFSLIIRLYIENKTTRYIKVQAEPKNGSLTVLVENDALYTSNESERESETNILQADSGQTFYLIKQYVELLNGTYSTGSKQTKGNYFKAHIPVIETNGSEEQLARTFEKTETEQVPSGERQHGILIAEDEEINFMLLETLLTDVFQLNPLLYHAANGKEAVDLYKSQSDKIDLILMDLKMPVLDGFSATEQIRSLKTNVPIIAQTAYNSKEYRVKAAESGCNDLISKPISRNVFRDILMKHLGVELQ